MGIDFAAQRKVIFWWGGVDGWNGFNGWKAARAALLNSCWNGGVFVNEEEGLLQRVIKHYITNAMKNISDFLDFQWSPKGFLGKIRYRVYDKEEGQNMLSYLKRCDPKDIKFTKRFVREIWMIPLFLHWRLIDYTEASLLPEGELIELKLLCGGINAEIERILGIP